MFSAIFRIFQTIYGKDLLKVCLRLCGFHLLNSQGFDVRLGRHHRSADKKGNQKDDKSFHNKKKETGSNCSCLRNINYLLEYNIHNLTRNDNNLLCWFAIKKFDCLFVSKSSLLNLCLIHISRKFKCESYLTIE